MPRRATHDRQSGADLHRSAPGRAANQAERGRIGGVAPGYAGSIRNLATRECAGR